MSWDWSRFHGSAEMLHYMRRDCVPWKGVIDQISSRRVAVQAGGCLGILPKLLAGKFGEAVYTFEPDPENFLALCHNAPEQNIIKFQAALGCKRGGVSISHERRSRKPGNAHEGIRHVAGAGPIPTLLLDDLALPEVDLIYLDVEGFELYALRGAEETIRRCQPVIALEINEMITYAGETPERVYAHLAALGYYHARDVGTSDHLFLPIAVPAEVAC